MGTHQFPLSATVSPATLSCTAWSDDVCRAQLCQRWYVRLSITCSYWLKTNKSIGDDTKAAARQSLNCIKTKKYGEKRFLIWRMEFLHPVMWDDHDIDFTRWPQPAMWHVALESWQWIHQVAAPCNVIRGSGMTCHWIRLNVRHIGILHLVSISTTAPQSTLSYCISLRFIQIGPPSAEKNYVMSQDGGSQLSWILGMQ